MSKEKLEINGDKAVEIGKSRKHAHSKVTRLVEFAKAVLNAYCWDYPGMDGMDMQEFAETLGLIKKETATADDVDEESDFEVGDVIYRFTDTLLDNSKSTMEGKL